LEDRRDVEVTGRRRGLADLVGFADFVHMHGVTVRHGVDRGDIDAQAAAGAGDPDRDFATIGNEELADHRGHILRTAKRVSGGVVRAARSSASAMTARVSTGSMMSSSQMCDEKL